MIKGEEPVKTPESAIATKIASQIFKTKKVKNTKVYSDKKTNVDRVYVSSKIIDAY